MLFDRDPMQMALDEAARHGASQTDLDQLRRHFRETGADNSSESTSTPVTDIPA
jgi:hypothetical protein